MRRFHHILILTFIAGCIAYPLISRRTPPPSSVETTTVAPAPIEVAAPVVRHNSMAEEAATHAHAAELGHMEEENTRRQRTSSRTYDLRNELRTIKHEAWNNVISTNWPAYQALHQKALATKNHQTPCTLCDGKGYMHFCVLCPESNGKCVTCGGTRKTQFGEDCAACMGKGKCFLCFGTGKMPCVFCDDGTIVQHVTTPPREMPIKCLEPLEARAKEIHDENERQSQSINVVSQWIAETPSAAQAIEEERIAIAASAPPTFWQKWYLQTLILMMIGCASGLVVVMRRRHKEEAEIRALAGKYLSDGREAARVKMPALFEVPTLLEDTVEEKAEPAATAEPENPQKKRLNEFFETVPAQLIDLLTTLQSLGRTQEPAEQQKVLAKMHENVLALQTHADCWELRPVWQMCSALELLLKRLAGKPKDATPSTLRTVANAIDVLSDLCVPGIRPDLIINPPVAILAVDDDPLCLRAITFALQKLELGLDVAADGERSVQLATDKYYDVIFMDIQMPGIDGLTACEQIHAIKKNETTPVIFVTAQSDFETRAQSSLKGGAELMAKPFLMFEITVKALTFAMRKRLKLADSLNRSVETMRLSEAGKLDHYAKEGSSFTTARTPVPVGGASTVSPASESHQPAAPVPNTNGYFEDELSPDFFLKVPAYLAGTRRLMKAAFDESDQASQQELLARVYSRLQALGPAAKSSHLEAAVRFNASLDSLVLRLSQNPKILAPSTFNTVLNALHVLQSLCVRGIEQKLGDHSQINILVVEDEPLARRAVVGTLQLAFGKPDGAKNGAEGLRWATTKSYDVVFSDIEMPGMGGFELCQKIHELETNRTTPVVFITSHTDDQVRNQAAVSGASDFITKPFLPIEINVKALTFAMQKRLQPTDFSIREVPAPPVPESAPRGELASSAVTKPTPEEQMAETLA